jgi:hypothetical protein
MKKIKNLRLRLELNTVRRLTTSNLEQVHGGAVVFWPKSGTCSFQLACTTSLETRNCPATPACTRE